VAIVSLYAFKGYLKVGHDADDALLQDVLDAAHVGVRELTCRNIDTADLVATERLFVPRYMPTLWIDDAAEVTSVVDYGTALTVDTHYQLEPVGNRATSGEYRPYSEIRRRGGWFPSSDGFATVAVTARWGWTTLPEGAVTAVKILGKDILANRDVTFGIAAFTEMAGIRARENEQVRMRLSGLSLRTGVG
jgi:hypothetical protein